MAKLRTRKRGKTWSYSFDAGQINGKRKIVEKGGYATEQEAYDEGTKALASFKNGNIAIVSEKISVGDFLDSWLEMKSQEVRINTVKDYTCNIKHIKAALGKKQLQSLRPRDVDAMIKSLVKEGKAKKTLLNILTVLKNALDYAVYPCELIKCAVKPRPLGLGI